MKKFVFLLIMGVFLGIGCTNTETPTTPDESTTPTTSAHATITDPESIDMVLLQRAYIYCQENNETPILRFDDNSAQTKLYCALPDGRYCDALAFYEGTCPSDTQKLAQANGDPLFEEEVCTLDVSPVCGTDGFTYVNRCIAKLQQINVAHDGQCGASEQHISEDASTPNNSSNKPTTGSSQETNLPPTSAAIAPSGNPVWIDILIDLSNQEFTKPYTTIESCTYSGEKLYLKTGSCPECFSILYNKNGQAMCYPGHDIHNACPDYFKLGTRGNACKVIWSGK